MCLKIKTARDLGVYIFLERGVSLRIVVLGFRIEKVIEKPNLKTRIALGDISCFIGLHFIIFTDDKSVLLVTEFTQRGNLAFLFRHICVEHKPYCVAMHIIH